VPRGSAPVAVTAPHGSPAVSAVPVPPWIHDRSMGDTLGSGPRLPALVRSVTPSGAADQPPAPAPKGNIVIPVTTALIVLAALVVVLLIT
jgi:hypothetical protein